MEQIPLCATKIAILRLKCKRKENDSFKRHK